MSLHLIAASITRYLGNEKRSMLRIRAENGRPLGGVKWPALLFRLPPGGIGLNIDMQHYKTRLLSGCRVTASCLSLPNETHTDTLPDTHTQPAHILENLGNAAHCDDCRLSGDWGMFTVLIVDVLFFSVFIVLLFFYHYFSPFCLLKIKIKLPASTPLSLLPSVYIMSFYGAMIFPIAVTDVAICFIPVSIICFWDPCFKTCYFFWNKIIIWVSICADAVCLQSKVYDKARRARGFYLLSNMWAEH